MMRLTLREAMMTANELANKLDEYNKDGFPVLVVEQAATMLRKLEAELTEAGGMIGVLREYISDLENGLDSSIKLNKAQAERNNEPVAWHYPGGSPDQCTTNKEYAEMEPAWTPLYTHPVNPKYDPETGEPLIDGYPLFSGLPHPVKELTDEEIEEVINQFDLNDGHDSPFYPFARAILRKAQEK
jgi:hypothetical protein